MELNLKKSLIFFDLETTGLNVATAKIVEISMLKIHTDQTKEIYTKTINPGIPIPAETSKIHKIFDEDVKDKPTFKELANEILNFIGNADLSGYNVLRYDLPVLVEELLRADIVFDISKRAIVDVQNIFHKMESRTLSAAYKFYCNKELIDAHSAEADTLATYEVLISQIEKYKNAEYETKEGEKTKPIVNDINALSTFSIQKKSVDIAGHIAMNENEEAVFNFGKYKNMKVIDVFNKEPQYYDWIMKSDFPEYTKRVFSTLYMKKFNNDSFKLS